MKFCLAHHHSSPPQPFPTPAEAEAMSKFLGTEPWILINPHFLPMTLLSCFAENNL